MKTSTKMRHKRKNLSEGIYCRANCLLDRVDVDNWKATIKPLQPVWISVNWTEIDTAGRAVAESIEKSVDKRVRQRKKRYTEPKWEAQCVRWQIGPCFEGVLSPGSMSVSHGQRVLEMAIYISRNIFCSFFFFALQYYSSCPAYDICKGKSGEPCFIRLKSLIQAHGKGLW